MVIIKNDTNRIKDSLALKIKPKKQKTTYFKSFYVFRENVCLNLAPLKAEPQTRMWEHVA